MTPTACEVIDRVYKHIDDARTSVTPNGPPQEGTEGDAGYADILRGALENILADLSDYATQGECQFTIDTTGIAPAPSQQVWP